jgi:hypothetical protein
VTVSALSGLEYRHGPVVTASQPVQDTAAAAGVHSSWPLASSCVASHSRPTTAVGRNRIPSVASVSWNALCGPRSADSAANAVSASSTLATSSDAIATAANTVVANKDASPLMFFKIDMGAPRAPQSISRPSGHAQPYSVKVGRLQNPTPECQCRESPPF